MGLPAWLGLPRDLKGISCSLNRRGRFCVFSRHYNTKHLCLSFPVTRLGACRTFSITDLKLSRNFKGRCRRSGSLSSRLKRGLRQAKTFRSVFGGSVIECSCLMVGDLLRIVYNFLCLADFRELYIKGSVHISGAGGEGF